jgi:hypothetical protein
MNAGVNAIGDWVRKLGQGAQESATKEGSAYLTGLATGIPKAAADVVAAPVAAGASLLGHITGNSNLRGAMDNYEHAFFDPVKQTGFTIDAYKALTGEKNLTPEKLNSLAMGQLTSGVITPGLGAKIPGAVGKYFQGGPIGAVADLLPQGMAAAGVGKVRNAVAGMIPDSMVQGAANLNKGVGDFVDTNIINKTKGAGNWVRGELNPRSATERAFSADSNSLNVLKTHFNAPEAVNIKDFGEAANARYPGLPTEEILANTSQTLKQSKIDPKAAAYIIEELKGSLGQARATQSKQYAYQNLDNQLNRLSNKNLSKDPDSVLQAANNVVDFENKAVSKLYAQGKFDLAKQAEDQLSTNIQKVYDKIKKKDPALADSFATSYEPAMSSYVSRIAMMMNPGAAAQDAVSIQLNLTNSGMGLAAKNGIKDYSIVEKNMAPFWKADPWSENKANNALFRREVLEESKGIMQGVDPLRNVTIKKTNPGLFTGIKDKMVEVLPKVFEDAFYGLQQGVREKIVEGSVQKMALAITRSTPGLIEGTEKFNRAVINNTKELLRNNTMLKEVKYHNYTNAAGDFTVRKDLNSSIDDMVKKIPVVGKEVVAAKNTLLGWASNQMRAFNAAPDAIGDVLARVKKTGKVTKIDKQQLVQSLGDIVATAGMFGARGLRLSGMGYTIPKQFTGGNEMDRSTAEQTLPSLIINTIFDAVNADPELRQTVLNGVIGNFFGSVPASGLINAPDPVTQITTGHKIFEGKLKTWKGDINQLITALANGDAPLVASTFLDGMTSRDIKAMATAMAQEGTGNEIVDDKGNVVTSDYARNNNMTELTNSAKVGLGLLKQNQPAIKDSSFIGKDQDAYTTSQDDKIVQKYSKYSLDQFTDNFDKFSSDISGFTPDAKDQLLEKVLDKMSENHTSSKFKTIKSNAGDYLKLTPTAMADIKALKEMKPSQVAEVLAYAMLTNSEKVAEVLTTSGKINDDNLVIIWEKANKIVQKRKDEEFFRMFREMNTKEAPTEEPEEAAPEPEVEYIEIEDD